jgi:hypothetical protein
MPAEEKIMQVPYANLSDGRREAFERFGAIYDLPVVRSAYGYLKDNYRGGRLLDVGAGSKHYIRKLLGLDENDYHSLDNDSSAHFTFGDVSEIPTGETYSWIILNQIVEHLTIERTADMLLALRSHLEEKGIIHITVPNVFHPTRYWGDPTHVTHWNYASLYAICRYAGLRVTQIYRYSKRRGPLDPWSWLVERTMRRLYQIDWCQSILLEATL